MDIRSLKYFICIVECRGITAAAEHLHMTQPPLTNQLKAMEEELGFPLFYRRNKKLVLTEKGMLLYRRSKELVASFDDLMDTFSDLRSGITGKLNVGTILTPGILLLPALIHSFSEKNPGVSVHLQEGGSTQLMEMLRTNVIDLAIIKTKQEQPEYSYVYIDELTGNNTDGEMCVIGRKEFFFSHPSSVTIEEIADLPIIIHTVQKEAFLDACRVKDVRPHIIGTNANVVTSINWCARGLGVAIVSPGAMSLIDMLAAKDVLTCCRLIGYRGPCTHDALVCRTDDTNNPLIRQFLAEAEEFHNLHPGQLLFSVPESIT